MEKKKTNKTISTKHTKIPRKISIDGKKIKVHKAYRKQYTEKSLNKKLLKKIFVPADKNFVSDFFKKTNNEKNAFVAFEYQKITSKKELKRLNLIAKEVNKQKGRIRIGHIAIALGLVLGLMVFSYFLRNVITRKILIGASEKTFGAKCEITAVDLNLFDSHLYIKNYRVANKNSPMKNLFEVGLIDIHFNLLELSRRKFVCKNIAVEDITWNTNRKTSGSLPKRKTQNTKTNPVVGLIKNEVQKITSQISPTRGLSAVKNQLDPRIIFEREKERFTTPKLAQEIMEQIPQFTKKWKTRVAKTEAQVRKTIAVAQPLTALDVEGIDSLDKLHSTLRTVKQAIDTIETNTRLAQNLVQEIQVDSNTVQSLLKSANRAVRNDVKQIKKITNTIKSFNLDAGSRFISSLFDSFVIHSLGKLYPYVSMALDKLQTTQETQNDTPQSLKDKVKALERLPGKNFIFEKNPLPSVVFHSMSLSGHDPDQLVDLGGSIKNISNNADQLGLPIEMKIEAVHGKMSETFSGLIDLRSYSDALVDGTISLAGFALNLPTDTEGVPSLRGLSNYQLKLRVEKNNTVRIGGLISVKNATLLLKTFEPKLVHTIYQNIISDIHALTLNVAIEVLDGTHFQMDISSDVDKQIARALEKELNAQIARIKKEVEKHCRNFLDNITKEYQPIVKEFGKLAIDIAKGEKDLSNVERLLKSKEAEIQKRITDYGKKSIKNALQNFF